MRLVLDASMALAWHLTRSNPDEAGLAQEALSVTMERGALVPHLWFPEVANAILVAERRGVSDPQASSTFRADLDALSIKTDTTFPHVAQGELLKLGRAHQLTAYDATYLELALRKAAPLATFDRKLAAACREAGVLVFGDPA